MNSIVQKYVPVSNSPPSLWVPVTYQDITEMCELVIVKWDLVLLPTMSREQR